MPTALPRLHVRTEESLPRDGPGCAPSPSTTSRRALLLSPAAILAQHLTALKLARSTGHISPERFEAAKMSVMTRALTIEREEDVRRTPPSSPHACALENAEPALTIDPDRISQRSTSRASDTSSNDVLGRLDDMSPKSEDIFDRMLLRSALDDCNADVASLPPKWRAMVAPPSAAPSGTDAASVQMISKPVHDAPVDVCALS